MTYWNVPSEDNKPEDKQEVRAIFDDDLLPIVIEVNAVYREGLGFTSNEFTENMSGRCVFWRPL